MQRGALLVAAASLAAEGSSCSQEATKARAWAKDWSSRACSATGSKSVVRSSRSSSRAVILSSRGWYSADNHQ
jgi:hypothetical protein